MKKQTKRLAVAGMLCALGAVILLIGSILDVLDLSAAALASFLVLYATEELGKGFPFLIYAATSLLSLLLLPAKLPVCYYVLFFGWYPMLKKAAERLPRWLAFLCRLIAFLLALAAVVFVSRLFFSDAETAFLSLGIPVAAGAILLFLLYDLALSRVWTAYRKSIRKNRKPPF